MKSCCYKCGWFKEEQTSNGVRYYCNDLDCTVDPYDPDCNYHNT